MVSSGKLKHYQSNKYNTKAGLVIQCSPHQQTFKPIPDEGLTGLDTGTKAEKPVLGFKSVPR